MKCAPLVAALAVFAVILLDGCASTKEKKKDTKSQEVKNEEKYPFLTRPEVRTIWVPDAIEGNRYIEGHRVFIIEKGTSWSKDND